jgi:hypothetical protein
MSVVCKPATAKQAQPSKILRHATLNAAEPQRSPRFRKIRAWEVVHTCDFARDIADVMEAQISAGMRPYLLTVGTDVAPKASVLQTWQDVRRWKKALDESGAQTTPQLIHAHSFASGMAAIRTGACTVYDLRLTIEERLTLMLIAAEGASAPGTWMARSFRTAEQFVLTKAAAVVVHTPSQREECIARGVRPQSVFVVADPISLENAGELMDLDEETRKRERESRNPQVVAEKYDLVYRYAFSRRDKGKKPKDSSGALVPIEANF